MANPYPAEFSTQAPQVRLEGAVTFTDPANQPGAGGGVVQSVAAGDASITIAGTAQIPTVAVTAQGVTQAKIADGAVSDVQVAAANKDGIAAVASMRTLGTGAQVACAGNDSRLSDARTPNGTAGGDLTGTYPNPTLASAGGGAAGPIGDATHSPAVTVDAKGRVTALSSVAITGTPPGGTAGGGLSGTYPNPTVAALQGVAVSAVAPTASQILTASDATHAAWATPSPGGVATVTAADTSIVIAGTGANPTVATASLDVIAGNHSTGADWSNSSHKITNLANGSGAQDAAAFGQIPAALPPNGAAGGDLGGSYPNPTVTSGTHLGAATVPIASLADPTTGKVIGSASSAAAAVFPPGYEIGYTQITSNKTITSTTESSGTALISPGALTFDGAAVMVEFFCPTLSLGLTTNEFAVICLFESATEIGQLAVVEQPTNAGTFAVPVIGRLRFTPSAGSHTYSVTGFKSGASAATVQAGAGGTATLVPAFVRFTKV